MKNRDIRKEKSKKTHSNYENSNAQRGDYRAINITNNKVKYRIIYDRYEAVVSLVETGEIIGIYRAAERNWKKGHDRVPKAVKVSVENFYA